jgi:exodeoxyribonuclease VII large subunit
MTLRLLPVGTFVYLLREALESDPLYSDLWLEGEVLDLSRSSAGHTYFVLGDDDGCLKCVLFRGQALRQHHLPRLGDQIVVHGGLSIYTRSGSMQLVADLVRPAGLGAITIELEYLRQRLEAEGLFDPLRKRALPAAPRRIGVVTSEHGAAWHDIVEVIARRYPLSELLLSPAQVQGDEAPESIVHALQAILIGSQVDVIILARGGGATDDLSAFNDERVVRAVFASHVPIVVGVGHATDRTLVEDVADLYAPTPSAAAELCVPSMEALKEDVQSLTSRLTSSFSTQRAADEAAMHTAAQRLLASSPTGALNENRAAVYAAVNRLQRSAVMRMTVQEHNLARAAGVLAALEPAAVLKRGYAAIQTIDSGLPVFSVAQVQPGSEIVTVLDDGSFRSIVEAHVTAAGTMVVRAR